MVSQLILVQNESSVDNGRSSLKRVSQELYLNRLRSCRPRHRRASACRSGTSRCRTGNRSCTPRWPGRRAGTRRCRLQLLLS